jgi:tRNA A37 threonylcarbamoyladenosine dehydratase
MEIQKSSQAICAKDIRKELKSKYPKIKFKVVSRRMGMGHTAVDVTVNKRDIGERNDMQFRSEIEGIISKYSTYRGRDNNDCSQWAPEDPNVPNRVEYTHFSFNHL